MAMDLVTQMRRHAESMARGINHGPGSKPSDYIIGRAADLIELQDEYIKFLSAAEGSLFTLAYAHGYRCPPELVKRGADMREKIATLKSVPAGEI